MKTTGKILSTPVQMGGINEYAFKFQITGNPPAGVARTVLLVTATTTDFPNLLDLGAHDFPDLQNPAPKLEGNLDNKLGWWVLTREGDVP